MRKISNHYSRSAVCALLLAFLAACGSKTTTITGTTTPSVFYSHSVAFRNQTTFFAWGANTYGQLGNNDTSGASKLVPQLVTGVPATGMDGVSAGGTHTLAFKNNSSAYAWGNNGSGQLGINSSLNVITVPVQVLKTVTGSNPAAVDRLSKVTAVAAGGNHSLAIVNPGPDPTDPATASVWAWGANDAGQLGDTTLTTRLTAVPVQDKINGAPLVGVKKISAGGSHSLALRSNGTVSSWGYNGLGQLGNKFRPSFQNISSLNRAYPDQVVDTGGNAISNVIDIAAGGSHSLFLTSDGIVWACGYNFLGQLGDGTTADKNRGVVQVTGLPGVPLQVAAGLDHSLVIIDDGTGIRGTVYAWGDNFLGQLGNGNDLTSVTRITPIKTPGQVLKGLGQPLTDIVKIIAIGNSSYAVDVGGQLWAWGDNTFGQLGINTGISSSFAVPVNNLATKTKLYHP